MTEKQTMSFVGYARVSTTDQDTSIQVKQLEEAGCDKVFHEQLSGKTRDRPQLEAAMEYMRVGDVFVVTRICRLARSLRDLKNIVHDLEERGIGFQVTEQQIDTTTTTGKFMLNMLGAIAEFERDMITERQKEGIEAAKKKGKYQGRPKSMNLDVPDIIRKRENGMPVAQIAREAGCSRTSIHKVFKEFDSDAA